MELGLKHTCISYYLKWVVLIINYFHVAWTISHGPCHIVAEHKNHQRLFKSQLFRMNVSGWSTTYFDTNDFLHRTLSQFFKIDMKFYMKIFDTKFNKNLFLMICNDFASFLRLINTNFNEYLRTSRNFFFHRGWGTTPGVPPRAIIRKLWG